MWIDTHIHIYDVTRKGVTWPRPDTKELYRKVTADDFLDVAAPSNVKKAVLVECAPEPANNIHALEWVKDKEQIAAVIAYIDPCAADFGLVLDEYLTYAKFRGLRIGSWHQCSELEKVSQNLALLPVKTAGVVDVLGNWRQLDYVMWLAREHPQLSFVVNHIADCEINGREPSGQYLDFLAGLAGHRNIFMKISGIISRVKNQPAPFEADFYSPVLHKVINVLGVDKCLYGSDWPVISLKGTYEHNFQVIKANLEYFGKTAVAKIMAENAARVYRI